MYKTIAKDINRKLDILTNIDVIETDNVIITNITLKLFDKVTLLRSFEISKNEFRFSEEAKYYHDLIIRELKRLKDDYNKWLSKNG